MNISSTNDLCEAIFKMEAEFNLLDHEINEVKLWQHLRMPLYYEIAETHKIISSPHPDFTSINAIEKLRKIFSGIKSSIFHHPFSNNSSPDTLVLDHSRSKEYKNSFIDIYTHFYIDELTRRGENICVIEKAENEKHIRPITKNRSHLDIIRYYRFLLILSGKAYPSKSTRKKIKELDLLIKNELGLNFSLYKTLISGYINYKTSYIFWRKLLEKKKPKKVVLVTSYILQGGLIKASKDLGIEVAELQHGVFSKYHLGYSFPNRDKELDYFPNTFYSWGKYWKDLIKLPIPYENVINQGFDYFHKMKSLSSSFTKKKNQILVLSQGIVSAELPKKILIYKDELSNYKIYYKLHPSEYKTWRLNPFLIELSKGDNIEIIDYDCNLYQKFAESEYQIGVFSTALFEGIAMECKTILLNLQGVEYMESVIKSKAAILHDDRTSLLHTFKLANNINTTSMTSKFFGSPMNNNV